MTISPPQWITETCRDGDWKHRVSFVASISPPPFCQDRWWVNGRAIIDASIAPLVAALNARGHVTQFCCSGLPDDHSDDQGCESGYIQFVKPVPAKFTPPGAVAVGTHLRFTERAQWEWLAAKLGVELV